MLNNKIIGPIFDRVDRVLADRPEYVGFRSGITSREGFGRFLEACSGELVRNGVPADDVRFAKRYPYSPRAFVRNTLGDMVERGFLPTANYEETLFETMADEPFDHGPYQTYIYPEEARLMFAVADILKPKNAVFVGSYYGYWAHWAIPPIVRNGGHVLLIDPDEEVNRVARRNIAASPYEQSVQVMTIPGEEFFAGTREKYDFVALDAELPRNHADPQRAGKRVYYPLAQSFLPRLAPRALLICHNILFYDHTGDPFFEGVIARNHDELNEFTRFARNEFNGFVEYASTEGIGVGIRNTCG